MGLELDNTNVCELIRSEYSGGRYLDFRVQGFDISAKVDGEGASLTPDEHQKIIILVDWSPNESSLDRTPCNMKISGERRKKQVAAFRSSYSLT